MGKVKPVAKAPAAQKVARVETGGIVKAAQPAKAKQLAKAIANKALNGKEPKEVVSKAESDSEDSTDSEDSKSEVSPDDDSDSDEDKEDSSDESSEDESVDGEKAARVNAKSGDSGIKNNSESDESSDAESESDSDVAADANPPKVDNDSSDSSESSEEEDSDEESDDAESEAEPAPATAATNGVNGTAKAAKADSSESEQDEDEDDDSESDSGSDAESDTKSDSKAPQKAATSGPSKRKAEENAEDDYIAFSKKAKADVAGSKGSTLFIGNLSWGIDDNSLFDEFKDFGELLSARVVTDANTGRSRGFGYLDFATSEAADKAYNAKVGTEVDGRPINLDYATSRANKTNDRGNGNGQTYSTDRAKSHGDVISPESDTLFVGNLPFDADEEQISEFFNDVCQVKSLRLPTDPESGNRKGFGYASFYSIEDAKTVLNQCNGSKIGSRNIRLDFASGRPDRGGSGGRGGFGGSGRGGFGGDRSFGGNRGRGGDRGRGGRGGGGRGGGGRGGRGGFSSTNRGGLGDFQGKKITF